MKIANDSINKLTQVSDWTHFSDDLEKRVVSGRHTDVKQIFNRLDLKKIPRKFAGHLAEIAWRISQPLTTLKILHGIMSPESSFDQPATAQEKMTYASALVNLGAVDEAIDIFNGIDSSKEPEVLFRKALALFKTWNYRESIPLLTEYIQRPELLPYKRLIGRINLAAAQVDQNHWAEASRLLSEIEMECEQNSHMLLLGSCLELQAQIEFFNQRFESALKLLEKSLQLLRQQEGEFSLYAIKWTAICRCFMNRHSTTQFSEETKVLADVRERAKALRNWETVRECDLFEAILTRNDDLAKEITIGTPLENYQQRIRRLYQKPIFPRGKYFFALPGSSALAENLNSRFRFDPYEKISGQALHEKGMLLVLFEALTIDFYKPSHIGALFQKIYSGEKFNPFTSPDRVLKLVKRLNLWFVETGSPLRVNLKKSEFSLVSQGDQSVEVAIFRGQSLTKESGYQRRLKEFFQDRTFSAKQAAEKLNMSERSVQKLISGALVRGQIKKLGNGRSTAYQVCSKILKKQAA